MNKQYENLATDAHIPGAVRAAEIARRSMFEAASRVIGYHTAALQSRSARNTIPAEQNSTTTRRRARQVVTDQVNDERDRLAA